MQLQIKTDRLIMIAEIRCRIIGRVQMVMYRDFVFRSAKKLNINGFVRNEQDGSVRVEAQGEIEKLEKFIIYLKKGSLFSRVDSVKATWIQKPREVYKGFVIQY
jgi:acylphosphatase